MTFRMKAFAFAAIVAAATLQPARAYAAIPGACTIGTLPSGAQSMICVPSSGWNGALVVLAHSYVAVTEPLTFADLSLPGGLSVPVVVQSLGYAFTTTTYRQNGLSILEGVDDIRELIAAFHDAHGVPTKTHQIGVSEGSLVTALLAEQSPTLLTSGLAMCGPIGSFQALIDYFGDFRVLFDYFFPGILIGSPHHIPPPLMANWETQYVPAITAAIVAHPGRALQLLRVANAPYDPADPSTIVSTTHDILWRSIFATNDAIQKLGGNPYGNRGRWYSGSTDDVQLNRHVQRLVESPVARAAVRAYETSGDLTIPLVTLHTTGDDVIPFSQEVMYSLKLSPFGLTLFTPVQIARYGHCNFTAAEILGAFALAAQ